MARPFAVKLQFIVVCNAEATLRSRTTSSRNTPRIRCSPRTTWRRAMTPKEIDLVQQSLPAILALRDGAPTRLHELYLARGAAPRPLFAGADAGRQVTLLITAVAKAVGASRPGDHDRVEPRSASITPAVGRTRTTFAAPVWTSSTCWRTSWDRPSPVKWRTLGRRRVRWWARWSLSRGTPMRLEKP